jgi:serine/threonine protein kinase
MADNNRGPWRKLKQIGEGSFGKVYLVRRNGEGPAFVMKEVNLRGLPRAEMISAQNEVSVLKKLRHPHVIAIQEALVVDDTLCIVMEYADGKDLDSLIAQRKKQGRPFSEAEVLKIFWQLTSALAHCHHDLHMLHRDLKPANVFMMANGDCKLGDFGLAKIIEATCALAKTQCGTPLYMSPELCLGRDYDRGADVWALGCILYELMTLTRPWSDVAFNGAGGMSALLRKIANSSLDLSPCKRSYSLDLVGVAAMLLAKSGKHRPALKMVLQMDVVKAAAPKPPTTPVDLSTGEGAERPLPPSWRKVPSASRPGQFSYLHVPTGYKQAHFPEQDELPEAVLAALKKATFTPSQQRPPPTAMATPQRRTDGSAAAGPPVVTPGSAQRGTPRAAVLTPSQHAPQTPRDSATPRASPTPSRAGATPSRAADAGTPQSGARVPVAVAGPMNESQPLPPSWRKVPSASRPGQFSYLHMPTGYKQAERPTRDALPPDALAAWQKAKGTAMNNRPPSAIAPKSAAAQQGRHCARYKLEAISEQRSNGQQNHHQQRRF